MEGWIGSNPVWSTYLCGSAFATNAYLYRDESLLIDS